jgi:hypothetical protein
MLNFTQNATPIPKLTDQEITLREVVDIAWTQCTWEYFQLATLRIVVPDYTRKYIKNCLNDSVEFNNFVRQLNDTSFRPRQVYRAWYYVRALVVKYTPDNQKDKYKCLDDGAKQSTLFTLVKFIGDLPQADPKKGRPDRKLSEDEWDTLAVTTRNRLLNDATQNCGYERTEPKDWTYCDIFGQLTDSPATSVYNEKRDHEVSVS